MILTILQEVRRSISEDLEAALAYARIAQLVERLTVDQEVTGSIPVPGISKLSNALIQVKATRRKYGCANERG